jgi:hypothetical protein
LNADNVKDLLVRQTGNCVAFTKLFITQLAEQGIVSQNNFIKLASSVENEKLFVANWHDNFDGGPGTSNPRAGYMYVNIPEDNLMGINDLTQRWQYQWQSAEVLDHYGISGQNNDNPAKLFDNHVIAKIDNMYYDPSYGKAYANVADINGIIPFLGLASFDDLKTKIVRFDIRPNPGNAVVVDGQPETWTPPNS